MENLPIKKELNKLHKDYYILLKSNLLGERFAMVR